MLIFFLLLGTQKMAKESLISHYPARNWQRQAKAGSALSTNSGHKVLTLGSARGGCLAFSVPTGQGMQSGCYWIPCLDEKMSGQWRKGMKPCLHSSSSSLCLSQMKFHRGRNDASWAPTKARSHRMNRQS